MYNDKILEHFLNPRNVGELQDADGIGMLGDAECGDFIKVYIKVDEESNSIKEIRFQISGCPAAIACGSAMTELAKGKNLLEASKIKDEDILVYLGGLPDEKDHCSNLGAGALRNAIKDYWLKLILRHEAAMKSKKDASEQQ
jgi:nitrogen fixation NifU-like protein